MTIDEVIKHCEETAYQNEILMKRYDDASGYNRSHNKEIRTDGAKGCEYLTSLYRQLAEWLKALKEIWDSGDCNDCRNGQCEWKPKLGQLVRFNCPHYVGVANGEVNADEDSD